MLAGSSPHTRGTHPVGLVLLGRRRFIPAYAGNASDWLATGARRSVHPRIRGERINNVRNIECFNGSSPHTRGTLRKLISPHGSFRFIPAYAGNAQMPGPISRPHAVHPRIRGERSPPRTASMPHFGSSPHTRGTPRLAHDAGRIERFIPAYAGNATISSLSFLHLLGSSPHTRGTLALANAIRKGDRFIPAYAGNASLFQMTSRRSSVHPRIRGERIQKVDLEALGTGSSPHTRGTQ